MPEPQDAYVKDVAATIADAIAEAIGPLLGSRPLLTIPQAASKLGIKDRKMEQMVRSGELASVLVGDRSRRIEQAEIDRYVAARREDGDGQA